MVFFTLQMCFAPQRRAIFGHRNFQNWSRNEVFCTFWLTMVLRATAACDFWTSELPKLVPQWGFFAHFDLQMCCAPQRRAIFGHRNFQNWSRNEVFCTFWLTMVLRATAACDFWTSELPKLVPQWGFLHILTYNGASRHSGVPFLTIGTSKMAPTMRCFVHFDLQMCFAPQPRAIFHLSAEQLPPHPPLYRGYFSNIRNHESLKKHSDSRRR